ncbi:MAG: type II toxin-antitoxin system VapC family toxin [Xenococcus sp. MO_188.B8]|nr:type II toxin-antitoxin system VapC family toxin [Xenococcus sp. MO_188.B8]
MSAIVFDSSVVIAILKQEQGFSTAEKSLSDALISTVNLAEVATYLARNSVPSNTIQEVLASFPIQVVPFDESLAIQTGCLYPSCKHLGLSLGDRACLALAISRKLPVLTADQVWSKLNLRIPIQVLR